MEPKYVQLNPVLMFPTRLNWWFKFFYFLQGETLSSFLLEENKIMMSTILFVFLDTSGLWAYDTNRTAGPGLACPGPTFCHVVILSVGTTKEIILEHFGDDNHITLVYLAFASRPSHHTQLGWTIKDRCQKRSTQSTSNQTGEIAKKRTGKTTPRRSDEEEAY